MGEEKENTALLVDFSGDRLDRTSKQKTAKEWCENKGFKFLGSLSVAIDVSRNAGKSVINSKLFRFASVLEQLSRVDYIIVDADSYCTTALGTVLKQNLDFCGANYDIVHLSEGLEEVYCFRDM